MSTRKRLVRAAAFAAILSTPLLAAHAQTADGPPQRVIVKWRSSPGAAAQTATNAAQAMNTAEARLGVSTARRRGPSKPSKLTVKRSAYHTSSPAREPSR